MIKFFVFAFAGALLLGMTPALAKKSCMLVSQVMPESAAASAKDQTITCNYECGPPRTTFSTTISIRKRSCPKTAPSRE